MSRSDEDEEEIPGDLKYVSEQRADLSRGEARDESSRREKLRQCCQATTSAVRACLRHKNTQILISLLLGQLLSLLLCGTGITSQLLVTNHHISVPTTQTFLTYALLGLVYGAVVATREGFLKAVWQNWWKYIILGAIDVEANYLFVLAYKYTNLTTVQLLDSFTIASVMVLSFFFLRSRFKIINFMGVALSLVGILSLVLADIQGSRAGRGSNPLLGDLLCLAGSLLYAVSNVAQEFLVKNHSIAEYLGFIGVTGSVASAIQLIVLERKHLVRIDWNLEIGGLFVGFAAFQFLFYSLAPHLLKLTSAVVFNLSLLTADIYTLLFGLFLFHYKFSFFYILSFILIVTGVFIYNLRQPSTAKKKKEGSQNRTGGKDGGGGSGGKEKGKGEMVSELRRAFFESHTYEMSESKQASSNHHSKPAQDPPPPPPPAKSKSRGLVSKLASKLSSKLPSRPTPTDQSGLESSSKRHMRTFEDLAEEERGEGHFSGASREGLIRERSSSSGLYGTVEKQMPTARGSKRRTARATSASPAGDI